MIASHSAAKRFCVVFDEFQDVLDMPEADAILASLRSKIQFLPDTPFVFLGSVRNRMRDIFDSPRSPFFKSAISFGVERIKLACRIDDPVFGHDGRFAGEGEGVFFFQLPFLSRLAVFLSPFAHGHSDALAEHPFYERIGTVAALGDY